MAVLDGSIMELDAPGGGDFRPSVDRTGFGDDEERFFEYAERQMGASDLASGGEFTPVPVNRPAGDIIRRSAGIAFRKAPLQLGAFPLQ